MLIVNSLNPPNRYGNIAVTPVLFTFEKKCTMSLGLVDFWSFIHQCRLD